MKKVDKGLSLFAALAIVAAVIGGATVSEGYRIHKLVNSVDDEGKVICALTGNERTRNTTVIVGKLILPETVEEQEYYCAPGKFYWVAK
ncbi:hypothetical protein FDJ47_gp41 [Enterobacter phage Ec_L1]|uniref:Uncharacterized protein n=1 Tax=Enterobacter phage Ec_L1 TaxID=2070180 RepID=A0A2P0W9W6_9CAUD|nr:hypothetical protein FDJ47_gp41 [Enterobacter phage Ec_L1]AUV57155.1 hypothetical protein Ec41 [Enterobacter phage Ec_L1]